MSTSSLRFEDMLDEVSNFFPWKERLTFLLKEKYLWENVDKVLPEPSYPTEKEAREKKDMKIQRVILDVVKHHLILHVA
jgi:hypothetical protein